LEEHQLHRHQLHLTDNIKGYRVSPWTVQYGCRQLKLGQNIDTTLSRRDWKFDNPEGISGREWNFSRKVRAGEFGKSL
jgi:hypothetical protein